MQLMVTDTLNITSREEDDILNQIYEKQSSDFYYEGFNCLTGYKKTHI